MIHSLLVAALLGANSGAFETACSADTSEDHHLEDVCNEVLKGAPAYSVTYRRSLSPEPASQQVMVYRLGDRWYVYVAGYLKGHGSVVETRRNDLPISDADAEKLVSRLTVEGLRQLSLSPYYGREDVVCTDGASLELEMARSGRKFKAEQHSCAGKTRLNEIAALFRQLALKYDPQFKTLLSGFQD
jgi:hypothetical protein